MDQIAGFRPLARPYQHSRLTAEADVQDIWHLEMIGQRQRKIHAGDGSSSHMILREQNVHTLNECSNLATDELLLR